MNNDYLMRQIEEMAQIISKTFFHKAPDDIALFDSNGQPLESGYLHVTIMALIAQGEINKAEDLLFEKINEFPSEDNLAVAVKFYSRLGQLSDEDLQSANFTRQEIIEGLNEVKAICEEL